MQLITAMIITTALTAGAGNPDGKYADLLYTILMPDDLAGYGRHCEWGYWTGDAYGTAKGLKPGFWVYDYPNWYVWKRLAVEDRIDRRACVNGKYRVLLHMLNVPGDKDAYGNMHDYGFSECYSYAGYDNLMPGYWVYVGPYWYVWAEMDDKVLTGGT